MNEGERRPCARLVRVLFWKNSFGLSQKNRKAKISSIKNTKGGVAPVSGVVWLPDTGGDGKGSRKEVKRYRNDLEVRKNQDRGWSS